jgi:hypothetical protein
MRQAADALQARLAEAPADPELVRISFSEEMDERGIFAASLQMGDKLLHP